MLATLYSLASTNLTIANSDYRPENIQGTAFATAALIATVWVWRRVPVSWRWRLVVCCLASGWTLFDVAGRRLPQMLGW